MTDKLREAANQARLALAGYVSPQSAIDMLDAALAATPQPASVDREALVEAIRETGWSCLEGPEAIADALLAAGYRKADPLTDERETLAWAVVRDDGLVKHVTGNGRNLARQWAESGDAVVRVAIRVVEDGGD